MSALKERPILFSAPMVRALLAGRKTQTRRAVKPQPPAATVSIQTYHHPDPRPHFWAADGGSLLDWSLPCPYGQVGDRLYVRETWQHSNWPDGPYDDGCDIFYRADYMDDVHGPDGELSPGGGYRAWKPSIHMPRSASRLTLEIVSVRVERLQDISFEDAIAEGAINLAAIPPFPHTTETIEQFARRRSVPQRYFAELWESINGAGSWTVNPWVWAVEFKALP